MFYLVIATLGLSFVVILATVAVAIGDVVGRGPELETDEELTVR